MKKKIIIGVSALAICLVLILLGTYWMNREPAETADNPNETIKEEDKDGNVETQDADSTPEGNSDSDIKTDGTESSTVQNPTDNTVDFNTSAGDNTQSFDGASDSEVTENTENSTTSGNPGESNEDSEDSDTPENSEQFSGDEGEWTGWY